MFIRRRASERRPLGVGQVLVALGGWASGGALAGAAAAALAIRLNPSLRGPGQAAVFLAWVVGAYALVFFALGSLVFLVLGILARTRAGPRLRSAGFAAHVAASLGAFLAFALFQLALSRLSWRGESDPWGLAASLACAVAAGSAVSIFAARLSRAGARALGLCALALPLLGSALALRSARAAAPVPAVAALSEGGSEPMRSADPPRVLLIGIDGADWSRIDPLVIAGRLPGFGRLIREGLRAELRTQPRACSPVVWTTIATGQPPGIHGVLDFTELRLPGLERGVQLSYEKGGVDPLLPRGVGLAPLFEGALESGLAEELPVSSLHRRCKALWNILSESEVRVGVVRWWATWPAEVVAGFLVSDNDPLMQVFAASKSRGGPARATLGGMSWPPQLAGELMPLVEAELPEPEEPAARLERLLAQPLLADLTDDERADLRARPRKLDLLELILSGDRFATAAALELWQEKEVSFLCLCLRAVDNLSHRLGTYSGVVDGTYEFTDELVGRLLDAAGDGATVCLVSDHGWDYSAGPRYGHAHGPPGVMVLRGPSVARGELPAPAHVLDVAPTILALFGLPPASDMPGRALRECFHEGSPPAAARAPIASYGRYRPEWTDAGDPEGEGLQKSVELLRALGYLK